MKKGVLVEVIDVDIKSPYKGLQVSHMFYLIMIGRVYRRDL